MADAAAADDGVEDGPAEVEEEEEDEEEEEEETDVAPAACVAASRCLCCSCSRVLTIQIGLATNAVDTPGRLRMQKYDGRVNHGASNRSFPVLLHADDMEKAQTSARTGAGRAEKVEMCTELLRVGVLPQRTVGRNKNRNRRVKTQIKIKRKTTKRIKIQSKVRTHSLHRKTG